MWINKPQDQRAHTKFNEPWGEANHTKADIKNDLRTGTPVQDEPVLK